MSALTRALLAAAILLTSASVARAQECVPEGGSLPRSRLESPPCCEGLVALGHRLPRIDGGCPGIEPLTYHCTRCGNGSCDWPENSCSCPSDCPVVRPVGECSFPAPDGDERYDQDVAGLQIGGVNRGGLVRGVQLGLANWALHIYGAQIGLVNINCLPRWERSIGLWLGAINIVAGHYYGAQIGLVNTTHAVDGVQLGLVNWADSIGGVQLGVVNRTGYDLGIQVGVVNVVSEEFVGVQLGVVNVARLSAIQVGLINIQLEGALPFMVGANVGVRRRREPETNN